MMQLRKADGVHMISEVPGGSAHAHSQLLAAAFHLDTSAGDSKNVWTFQFGARRECVFSMLLLRSCSIAYRGGMGPKRSYGGKRVSTMLLSRRECIVHIHLDDVLRCAGPLSVDNGPYCQPYCWLGYITLKLTAHSGLGNPGAWH